MKSSWGRCLTAGVGQNAARQALIKAGLPVTVPATTINKVCGSGLKAVMLAAQAIANGDAEIVVAGGQENMSASPHVMQGSRDGYRMGDAKIIDSMIVDGLWDVYNQYHMGITAENVAKEHSVDRATQDKFALASQQKAAAAQDAGHFKEEIVAVPIPQRKGRSDFVRRRRVRQSQDQRRGVVRIEAGVRQAGQRDGGQCVGTERWRCGAAGDVGSESEGTGTQAAGDDQGIRVGRRRSEDHGHGAGAGVAQGIEESGLDAPIRLDLMEINEAFAAQACAVNKDMGWDTDKINVNGGAIALGHPIGASGARILVTLLHEMKRRDAKKGLAALCIGGGMGVALAVER